MEIGLAKKEYERAVAFHHDTLVELHDARREYKGALVRRAVDAIVDAAPGRKLDRDLVWKEVEGVARMAIRIYS